MIQLDGLNDNIFILYLQDAHFYIKHVSVTCIVNNPKNL